MVWAAGVGPDGGGLPLRAMACAVHVEAAPGWALGALGALQEGEAGSCSLRNSCGPPVLPHPPFAELACLVPCLTPTVTGTDGLQYVYLFMRCSLQAKGITACRSRGARERRGRTEGAM